MQRRSWHFEEGCSHTYGHGYLPFLTINQVFNLFGSHFRLLAATSYYLTCQFKFNCKWGFLPVVNTWLNELTTNRRIFVSPLWMPPQCPIIIIFRKIHLTREPLNSAKINQLRAMQLPHSWSHEYQLTCFLLLTMWSNEEATGKMHWSMTSIFAIWSLLFWNWILRCNLQPFSK